jgi:Tol biopolymer transport system component
MKDALSNAGRSLAPLFALSLSACGSGGAHTESHRTPSGPPSPLFGGLPADHLIQPGEQHFEHLWMLTTDGENAEAYWNPAGDRLVFQRRAPEHGIECDRIFVTVPGGPSVQVSNGRGVTTCAYFMPDGKSVLYASTHGAMDGCPPPLDPAEFKRLGYFWRVFPEYDVWVQDLAGGEPRRLTETAGYDAEATVSPRGDRIVFTSERSGDLELWTSDLEGRDLKQVTHTPGYDGGAFFSNDGKKLVFRSQRYTPGKEAEEIAFHHELLKQGKVNPTAMELAVCDVDGSNRRTLGPLGGASFAPFFYPDDSKVIFSTNHHDPSAAKREFDLFAIDLESGALEQITTHAGFESFAMFSPDGRYLVFASNRGQRKPGETNLFLAQWK